MIAAGAVAALAVPAPALAANASVTDGRLTITAAPEETNDSGITLSDKGELQFFDNNVAPTTGPGCRAESGSAVCPAQGVTSITVSLGDRSDSFSIEASTPPVTYSGGPGFDSLYYGGSVEGAASVTLDGVANDGRGSRADNISPDVENLQGTAGDDTLIGASSAVLLFGNSGNDVLTGGTGNDRIKAAYVEDTGEDLGVFTSQGRDTVTCGEGNDQVFAGSDDTIAGDCEVIGKRIATERYAYTGSAGNDRIQVDEFVSDATVHGGGGNDLVTFPGHGNGSIFGDAGNDTLSGDEGFDKFSGGVGKDRILARDKSRDAIFCGPGRDTVAADKKDKVARDCEKVSRR